MPTLTNRPLVSDEIVDDLAEEARAIVNGADYTSCPVPGQEKVQRFQVMALSALIHNARKNGNGHNKWGLLKEIAKVLGPTGVLALGLVYLFLTKG